VFQDFEEDFDADIHQEYLEYFNANPDLLKGIQGDLDGDTIRWSIDGFEQRLLFVPELREEYASMYQRYCEEVVAYVLERTRLENPIQRIQTLVEEKPEIPDHGVTVFLVHNLEKECVATYTFVNPQDKKIQVRLSGRRDSGDVGSYTSDLYVHGNGTVEFVPRTYSIWQNTARNPYTALIVPAEETLHVALRDITQEAIKKSLRLESVKTAVETARVAEEWIQVEEAIVGGVVHSLMGEFLEQSAPSVLDSLAMQDVKAREGLDRYLLLRKGIRAVERLGTAAAVRLYCENPGEFRELLKNL
jgi:hypothetical protein